MIDIPMTEKKGRVQQGTRVLSAEEFIIFIDQQIIRWWEMHCSGSIKLEQGIYQKLLIITKLVFHVTIGQYYVCQLTPSDLFKLGRPGNFTPKS